MMPDERDHLAAEWVLGTLPEAERAEAARLAASDPDFVCAVQGWQDRLAPLDAATAPVPPPPELWARIESALAAQVSGAASTVTASASDAPGSNVIKLARRVRTWRRTAAFTGALAAGLAAVVVLDRLPAPPEPANARFVAVVNRDASLPALIVDVDTRKGEVTVRSVAAEQPAGKSLELWVIPEGEAPRSLGVIDPAARILHIVGEKAGVLPAKGAIAVTLEPQGGSPIEGPTGPVVYSGALIPVAE
jgi:anti-sigma-K factor RskA